MTLTINCFYKLKVVINENRRQGKNSMKFTSNLRNSTATAALLLAFGASGALAQATSATNMGASETIVTSATFTAGNVQELTATPSATTSNNNVNISLTVSDAIDDVVTAATPATNNLTTASATGNSSTAAAALLFSPSTAGDTAAVGTLQSVEAGVTASSSSDTHSIVIENDGSGIRTLTGTSLSDNNDITAAATGNNATSTITAASGLDLVQAGAGQASLDIDSSLVAAADNDVAGDLIVSSSQEIDGNLTLSSTVGGAATTTLVEGLDTATVTVSNSDQASTSIGNSATSSISSLDTTASITASTAVSNLQTIVPSTVTPATTISATTTSSTIEIQSGVDSNGNATGDVTNTTISVAGNDQTAGATGSVSTQSITLDASSITGEGAAAVISDADAAADGKTQLSAAGDSIIGNVQTIDSDVTVSGTVSGNNIRSVVADLDSNDIDTSTLEVTGNRQAASATGVSTSNTLALTSGATMSAAGAVGSVQEVDGSVTAVTTSNSITNAIDSDDNLDDSSMRTTANAVTSAATGASATNSLATTSATNNLSVALNTGSVQNSAAAAGTADQYSVTAGQALTNDQSMASTAVVSAETTANQILTQAGQDANDSTLITDNNRMSASATANSADNGILLSFNNLVGTASGAGTGVIAATANEQTLADNATVTARVVGTGGVPILTAFDSDVFRSSVSTSGNTVSASASGNVTSGNNVVVDATNITSGSEAAPSIVAGTGAQTTTGSFVAASTQLSGADILASQRDSGGTTSNTIRTTFGNDIEDSSTVVSDDNVLSAVATANSANNAVQLGDANTATVAASGTVANYQATAAAGSVTAEIGITGSDPVAGFTSLNAATAPSTASDINYNSGTGVVTIAINPVTITFDQALTTEEATSLNNLGWTATAGSTTVIAPVGTYNITGILTSLTLIDPTAGGGADTDESFTVAGFTGSGSSGVVNGAGVIVSVSGGDGITDSTVSVSGNTAVGEVTGNVATNVTSATATTVTGLSATATSINAADFDVAPANADLATASLQDSASALSSDVAATFAILSDGEIDVVADSTQTVSDNLQQSYATANRATNSVNLTATNTDADTALESAQRSTATVSTTSDLDVVANAGGTTFSLAMEGNVNQSVANGNVATNATTVDVTNATATGAVDATIALTTLTADANNALASLQSVSANVTASATTDVYNQDVTRTGGNEIISSDVSLSSNSTIAQATGNNGTQTLTLGDAGTANMDRTGVLVNNQAVTSAAIVSSTVNQDVDVTLSNTGSIPIQSSSVSVDPRWSWMSM
ncbi:beta strand repeat-containing protein [Sulfitobacter sp. M22298]|uniref:beta strand repeat-containing protein n=1 Tax=Sulfitobacter sp. M22298 TaxID=3368575 RepID=UPI003745B142